jgi:NitT/TauT family transport system ATP-binding protein
VIEIRGLTKVFQDRSRGEDVVAIKDLSVDVRDNEFLTVIGPSGCGKTTLLRTLAGLEGWDEGEVLLDGRPLRGPGPERAMVFQNFALLPWANVLDNIAFGLEMRGVHRQARLGVAERLVRLVGLTGFERRLPRELSGGMQQRVGLARALAIDPRILLMDEPFGALDEQTRRTLQEELLGVWEREPKTVLFITHNMAEAVLLGDRIVLMTPRPGRVKEVIDNPLPRPRPRDVDRLPAFGELRNYLWEQLRGMQTETPPQKLLAAAGAE